MPTNSDTDMRSHNPISADGKLLVVIRKGQLIHVPQGIYTGTWRVVSVSDDATGTLLKLRQPDAVSEKIKKALISTLIKAKIQVCKVTLTGIPSLRSNPNAG